MSVTDTCDQAATCHRFRAMGCGFLLVVDREEGEVGDAIAEVEAEIARLEQVFSRFRPESELSLLNRQGTIEASDDLRDVLALALAARVRSGGRFDPTVHDALVGAGYDRSFELLGSDTMSPAASPTGACGGAVELDGSHVRLGPGVRIDLGGIAKGYAADRALAMLAEIGPALVDAGGDVACCGRTQDEPWAIAAALADRELTLGLAAGAVATSGRDHRRWRRAGVELHHLVDPATGAPAVTDLLRVTAVAHRCVDAEVEAKSLLLAGLAEARREADARSLPAVLVDDAGRTHLAGGIA